MPQLRFPDLRSLSGPQGQVAANTVPADDSSAPVFDLLRETRARLGQEPIAPVLSDRRGLLVQGTALGAVLLGVVFGVIGLVYLRHQVIKTQMGSLVQVEAQAASLQQELASRNQQMATITEVNRQLSSALSNVRPTSALMSELQLRTPDGVQLLSAEAGNANLTLKGVAIDPLAFARLNALQLELRRSPLFNPQSISLSRLERKAEGNEQTTSKSPVQFQLTAQFASLDAARLAAVLRQLGSDGMARRLQLLQREGLLP